MREALMYEKLPDEAVRCCLCRHRCTIPPGKRGICRVRENRAGVLVPLVYGRPVAEHVDPVEKKPLFHFLPGSSTYSIATVGCNFRCRHCQNHSIAQFNPAADGYVGGHFVSPSEIVQRAVDSGCRSISYTYTEPTVFYEYVLEIAQLGQAAGLKNILVTNGYMTAEALDGLAPHVDAANIDLKGFDPGFYERVVGGRLDEVLDCIRDYHRRGIWIEITSLIIPGENDSAEQLDGIAAFIANDLGPQIPWHISRFFPQYRMTDRPPTPPDSLERALAAGKRNNLQYLYVGNIAGGQENTVCPGCGKVVIERQGYHVLANHMEDGCCRACGVRMAGVW
jgi:pyruvate formate lyase activating enzyme